MNCSEVLQLKDKIGHIVSMNSFLSTSKDRNLAIQFAQLAIDGRFDSGEMEAVVFEIEADPRISIDTPFADIASLSAHPTEDECLFHLNSLFRLLAIERSRPPDHTTIIRLALVTLPPPVNDTLAQAARTALFEHLDYFGRMAMNIVDMMHSFASENRQAMTHQLIARIKNANHSDQRQLFTSHGDQAVSDHEYPSAITLFSEALRLDPSDGRSLMQLAKVYYQLDDDVQTIFHCRQAIELWATAPCFLSAYCHRLLGMSLARTGRRPAALLEFRKSLEIFDAIELNQAEANFYRDMNNVREEKVVV